MWSATRVSVTPTLLETLYWIYPNLQPCGQHGGTKRSEYKLHSHMWSHPLSCSLQLLHWLVSAFPGSQYFCTFCSIIITLNIIRHCYNCQLILVVDISEIHCCKEPLPIETMSPPFYLHQRLLSFLPFNHFLTIGITTLQDQAHNIFFFSACNIVT